MKKCAFDIVYKFVLYGYLRCGIGWKKLGKYAQKVSLQYRLAK